MNDPERLRPHLERDATLLPLLEGERSGDWPEPMRQGSESTMTSWLWCLWRAPEHFHGRSIKPDLLALENELVKCQLSLRGFPLNLSWAEARRAIHIL